MTAHYLKDPTDKQWANEPAYQTWRAWLEKYYPGADVNDVNNVRLSVELMLEFIISLVKRGLLPLVSRIRSKTTIVSFNE